MALVKFVRGTDAAVINDVSNPIEDGRVSFATDTEEIYLDYQSTNEVIRKPFYSDRLKDTGDTMTGILEFKGLNDGGIPIQLKHKTMDSVDPSAIPTDDDEFTPAVGFYDKNNVLNGIVRTYRSKNTNIMKIELMSRLPKTGSNTPYTNRLSLGIDPDGNKTVDVHGAGAEWRDALNTINRSGDELTNAKFTLARKTGTTELINIVTQNNARGIRLTGTFDMSVQAGSDGGSGYCPTVVFTDSEDKTVGYVRSYRTTTDNVYTHMVATRTVNNTSYSNSLNLGVSATGAPIVNVGDNSDTKVAWCNAIGAVNKAGDIMNSSLGVKSSNLTDGMSTTTTVSGQGIHFYDSTGQESHRIAYADVQIDANAQKLRLGARRTVSGAQKENQLLIGVDTNGDPYVQLWSNATSGTAKARAAWCDAIGAVPTTMTGRIYLKDDTGHVIGTTHSGATNMSADINFRDSAGTGYGSLSGWVERNGSYAVGLLSTGKDSSDNTLYNTLQMGFDATRKTPFIKLTYPNAWLQALGLTVTEETNVELIKETPSDITVSELKLKRFGKNVNFRIVFKSSAQITANSSTSVSYKKIGKLNSAWKNNWEVMLDLRPITTGSLYLADTYAYMSGSGEIYIRPGVTIAANSNIAITGNWILS